MVAMVQMLTPARSRRLLIAIGISMLCAVVIGLSSASPKDGALLSGDFPAFYAAGKIVAKGDGRSLYDPALQSQIQREALPERDGFLAFAYPPWFAALFAPFSVFGFTAAKLIWVSVLLVLSVIAARVLAGRFELESALAVLLLPPLLHANVAGQNTALSLLCVVGIVHLLSRPADKRAAFLLGAICAAFCFKPHFGLIASIWALCFVRGSRASLLLGLVFVAFVVFLLSALVSGFDWAGSYLHAVRSFSAQDNLVNAGQLISLPRLLPGGELWLSVLLIALMLRGAFYSRRPEIFLAPAIVLCAPHVLYYDAALLLPLAMTLRSVRLIYAASFVVAFVAIIEKGRLGAQPIEFLALLLFILAARAQEFGRFNKVEVSAPG